MPGGYRPEETPGPGYFSSDFFPTHSIGGYPGVGSGPSGGSQNVGLRPRRPGDRVPVPPVVKVPRSFAANDPSYANVFRSVAKKGKRYKGGGVMATSQAFEALGFDVVSGMLAHERNVAQQQAQDYRRGVLSDTRDVGSTADAKARRPYQELSREAIERQAQPKYLPTDLPTIPDVGIPDYLPKSVPTVEVSPDAEVPYNQNDGQTGQKNSPADRSTTDPRSPAAPSIPGQTAPFVPSKVNPNPLLDYINVTAKRLLEALNPFTPPVRKAPPTPPTPKTPFTPYNPFPPATSSPPQTPFDLTGVNATGVRYGFSNSLSEQSQPVPQEDLAQCKKGDGPPKKKGECGQGYFKQTADGQVEYKFWSRRKCGQEKKHASDEQHSNGSRKRSSGKRVRGKRVRVRKSAKLGVDRNHTGRNGSVRNDPKRKRHRG